MSDKRPVTAARLGEGPHAAEVRDQRQYCLPRRGVEVAFATLEGRALAHTFSALSESAPAFRGREASRRRSHRRNSASSWRVLLRQLLEFRRHDKLPLRVAIRSHLVETRHRVVELGLVVGTAQRKGSPFYVGFIFRRGVD